MATAIVLGTDHSLRGVLNLAQDEAFDPETEAAEIADETRVALLEDLGMTAQAAIERGKPSDHRLDFITSRYTEIDLARERAWRTLVPRSEVLEGLRHTVAPPNDDALAAIAEAKRLNCFDTLIAWCSDESEVLTLVVGVYTDADNVTHHFEIYSWGTRLVLEGQVERLMHKQAYERELAELRVARRKKNARRARKLGRFLLAALKALAILAGGIALGLLLYYSIKFAPGFYLIFMVLLAAFIFFVRSEV